MTDQIKIVVHSEEQVLEELVLVDGQSQYITSAEGLTYEIQEISKGTAPQEFILERSGDNLELYLTSESTVPEVIFEDYYLLDSPSPLVGMAEDGQFYTYVPQSGNEELLAWNLEDNDSTYQSLGYETAGSAVPWWPILLAGLLLIGGAAAIAGAKSSSDDNDDNSAPAPATGLIVSDDGTEVSGNGEAGSTISITDPDGNVIGTGTVGDDGTFVVNIDPKQTDGQDLEVVLVDGSGNTSDPAIVTAPDITGLVAANNSEEVVVDVTPSVSDALDQSQTIASVLNVGAGEVADVALGDLSDLNSMLVTVDSNTDKSFTLGVSGGGVVVASTYDLYVYKENTLNGTWELQDDYTVEDWFTTILLVGGVAPDQDITLPEGNYRIALNTQGVDLVGAYTLTADNVKVLDYTDPIGAQGTYVGNVVENVDTNDGIDTFTTTTTIKSVAFNGNVVPLSNLNAGETVDIDGKYGTLTIASDGDYTYEIDSFKFAVSPDYDETETFTYTIQDTANPSYTESSADLSIKIVREESEPVIVADTVVMTILDPAVGPSSDTIDPITNINTVGVALGPVLNVDALPDEENSMKISVAEDTLRTVTFEASGGGLAIGATPTDLLIYREDESTGKLVLVHTEEDWYTVVGVIIAVGIGPALELTLPPGSYIAVLQGDPIGINIGTGTTLSVTADSTTDYSESTASGTKTGQLDADMTELLSVDGALLEGGNKEIIGEYGTLSINSDGSYVYTLNEFSAADEKPYGEMESFSYIFEKDGDISKGRLNLKLDGGDISEDQISSSDTDGNIFDNDQGAGYWSEIVINDEHLYIQGTLGESSVDVPLNGGGTLTLSHDGSYSFSGADVTESQSIDYTLTSVFGTTYQGAIEVVPPVSAAPASFSLASVEEPESSVDESDDSDLPSFNSLVDDSDSLALDGEPVAGSSVANEQAVDSYSPSSEVNTYLDEDTSAGDSLV